jgi:integrase
VINKNMEDVIIINTVNPIRNLEILGKILEYLECKSYRNYMIVFLGVNTGLRISDLRKLTIYDVMDKDHICIRESKTGIERKIPLLHHVRDEIKKYLIYIKNNTYLFEPKYNHTPLSRQAIYYMLKNIEIKFGLESLGTHTLRKTFGYHFYMATKDIATLMIIFNHCREEMTLKYIGITQDRIDSKTKEWGGIKYRRLKLVKHIGD